MSLAVFASGALLLGQSARAQNTEKDVINGQSDLFLSGTYLPSGVPTVTSDINFTNVAYSPAAFTLSGNITVGSLNDSRVGQTLSISNTSAAAKTITLGGAGDLGDSVSGVAADLLFVANGGGLTINGGSGTTALGLVLGQTGNFDVQGNGTLNISSVISDGGSGYGFTKTGSGTLNFNNLTADTYTGATTIAQGTLNLSYYNNANATQFISSSSALVMGGTTSGGGSIGDGVPILFLQGNNGSARTQTFNGFTANAGASQIIVQAVNANVTLALGAVSNTVGGTVNFSRDNNGASAPIITTSSSNDASGILGGWAVTNATIANSTSAQAPTDYATVSGGQIVAYTGYTAQAAGAITSSTTSNAQVTTAGSVALSVGAGTTDLNTLSLGAGATGTTTVTIASGGVLRLGANGGMLTGSGTGSIAITGGTLTAGGSTVVNNPGVINLIGGGGSNPFTINSVIADNGTGAVSLVYSQYSNGGNLVIGGANTYSGGTFINAGRLQVNSNTAFGTGAVTVLAHGQAYLNYSGTMSNNFNIEGASSGNNDTPSAIRIQGGQTLSGKITLLGDAQIDTSGGTNTLSGQITGNYNLTLTQNNGSTTTLSNTANNFGGNLNINGTDVILGASEVIPDAVNGTSTGNVVLSASTNSILDLNGKSETINGLSSTGSAIVRNNAAGTSVLTVGGNNATTSFTGTVSNTTGTLGITKVGTGTQTLAGTLSYGGVTNVNAGTLKLTSSLTGNGAVNVNSGGTLNTSGTGITFGGATTVLGGSTTATRGTISLSGNNLATDVLTLSNASGLTVGGLSGNSSALVFDTLFSGGNALADKIAITNPFTVYAGGAVLTINSLGGIASGQTYNLITFGSGSTYNGSAFTAGSGTTVDGLTLANTNLSFGVTGSLNVTATAVQLVTSGAAAPNTAYFSGAQGSAWNATSGSNGNFTTDQAGTTFLNAYPASNTDVIYVADNGTNFATSTLGQNFDINSLTFRGAGPTATTAVNIGGSNALSIEGGGITLASGNAGVTLSMSNLNLGASQTYTNNSSNALTIASTTAISSNATSGTTTLTLSNTSTGTTTINGTIGNGTGTNTVAVAVNNTGTGAGATTTFNNANTYSGGTTVTAGTAALGNVSGFGTGSVAVGTSGTVAIGLNATIGNAFTGAGTVTINTAGGNTQFSSATAFNGFTGTLNVNSNGGNKAVLNVNGQTIGSGATVNVANGATFFLTTPTPFAGVTFNVNGTGNGEGLGALRLEGATFGASSAVNLLTDSSIGGNNNSSTINAVIAGTGGLSKVGGNTLILGGANTYGGTTTINGGALNLSNALALQNSTLNYTGNTLVFDQSVTGNAFTFGGLSGSSNIALSNNAGTSAAISLTVGGNNASTAYSGVLSGTGSNFTKTGTGTFELDTAATLTGNFTVGNGILYVVNNTNTITAGPVIFGTAGAANNTAMTFSQNGRTFASAISTQGTGGTNTLQAQGGGQGFTFTGGFTLGNNLTLSTFGGTDSITVQTGTIGGAGNLVTNVTTISAGGGGGAAGTTGASGGTITLNSAINHVGTITNSGNGTATVTINGSIGSNVTGVIQNSATSPLTLAAVNTYSGPTTVSAGTLLLSSGGSINSSNTVSVTGTGALTLQNSAALSDTGTLSMVSGTTLNLNAASGSTETIGNLILDGTAESAGTYTAAQLMAFDPGITFGSSLGETLTIAPVPEPATWLAGFLSLGALGYHLRRRMAGKFGRQSAA